MAMVNNHFCSTIWMKILNFSFLSFAVPVTLNSTIVAEPIWVECRVCRHKYKRELVEAHIRREHGGDGKRW